MKLTVEFEEDDLREMFTKFFKEAGFDVLSLDDICNQFKNSFPEGLKVIVEPGAAEEVPINLKREDPEKVIPKESPSLLSLGDEDVGLEREPVVAPTAMSMTDLMDPTISAGDGNISAINKLVTQSTEIKSTKNNKDSKA